MARLLWLFALCMLALAAPAQARDRTLVIAPKEGTAGGEARNALVIGNSAYAQGPLRNPVNDARAMAKALGEAGFRVQLVEDASAPAMQRAVRDFGDRIAKGGVGLFYFAGHGLQVRGRNYLVPVNADIAREDEIEFSTIDVNLVLAKMDSAKNGLNIVILDACRNNPFQRSFRSVQAGLAQMDAPTGTFIAFATAPGSVAADGAGENGVYTRHLLAEMRKPGLPIEQVFKHVRNGVMADTGGQQIPWESSSLRGDFAFLGTPGAVPSTADVERMIQAALERQRKELEAQGVVAKPAPQPAALGRASLPRQGDSWTYRMIEPQREGPVRRSYTVTVTGASAEAILERFSIDGGSSGEWAHSAGPYLAPLGAPVFSPYLPIFEPLSPGKRLGRVAVNEPACTGNYQCHATARIAARETVSVPAGTFDAIKVVVEQLWSGTHASMQAFGLHGGRELVVWYAPQVKRAVKFSSRLTGGSLPPIETDFDLELVSFKLN